MDCSNAFSYRRKMLIWLWRNTRMFITARVQMQGAGTVKPIASCEEAWIGSNEQAEQNARRRAASMHGMGVAFSG
jgi:hypothetical protein